MSLTLHYHPLSSYCWKVLIALYEKEIAFTPSMVDLGDADSRAALAALWPMVKMPVLEDRGRGEAIAETSIIIEYLDIYYPGPKLIPADPEEARRVRLWDRVHDLHLQTPMQKIVADRIRAQDVRDPFGVEEARRSLATAVAMVDREMATRDWAAGDSFTMADCAAAPALFYADKVMPFEGVYPDALAFLERLKARPSFARVLEEAEPYFQYFPAG